MVFKHRESFVFTFWAVTCYGMKYTSEQNYETLCNFVFVTLISLSFSIMCSTANAVYYSVFSLRKFFSGQLTWFKWFVYVIGNSNINLAEFTYVWPLK
jgi:hypothetical protein